MFNKSISKLILRTADLSELDRNDMNTEFTWKNINLRILLGDMYDKYERFNLCLQNISTDYINGNIGLTNDDYATIMMLKGFEFVNCNYLNKLITDGIVMATFQFTPNSIVNINYNDFIVGTFQKNNLININISYLSIMELLPVYPSVNSVYPQMVFIFNIVGCEDYKIDNIMDKRIDIK